MSAEQTTSGPPKLDSQAVSRIATAVEIENVELVGSHYEREDDTPSPVALHVDETPRIRIGLEWEVHHPLLVVVASFATVFDVEPQPYSIVARFRLTYQLDTEDPPDPADVEQFAHWNAMFNAWPYWREFVASTINRGQLPRFVVPVMGVPRTAPGSGPGSSP